MITSDFLILILLIAFSGFFSASEVALISTSRFKVRFFLRKKQKGSVYLSRLKEDQSRLLTTILIANNFVNITATVLATELALELFPDHNIYAYVTGIMTFIILVFGEIVPKHFASTKSSSLALKVAPFIYFLGILFFPLVLLFDFISKKLFRVKMVKPKITEEEIRNIVDMAKEEGGIDKDEKELIHRIFRFDDIDVDEIKIHAKKISCISVESTLKQALRVVKNENFARIPVYDKEKHNIVGIFYYKDALPYITKKRLNIPIQKIMREPIFISSTKKIDSTLRLLQNKHQQMALVVGPDGLVSGLVTMEDILEEIFGDITDETEDR